MKTALAVAALLLLPGVAGADLYRWTAPDGTVHYTADAASIPPAWRQHAESLAHPQARPLPALIPGPEVDAGAAVTVPWSGGAPVVVPVDVHPSLAFVFAVPDFGVVTARARAVLAEAPLRSLTISRMSVLFSKRFSTR